MNQVWKKSDLLINEIGGYEKNLNKDANAIYIVNYYK